MKDILVKSEQSKKFRETHPEYHKLYMRERRKKIAEQRIQKAFEMLYGKENNENR